VKQKVGTELGSAYEHGMLLFQETCLLAKLDLILQEDQSKLRVGHSLEEELLNPKP
jgi:hypothetical protein